MGFAGFVTSGVTPAVAGALRGRNMGRQQAEEQRRYDTEQARLASQTKWTQQQALEQAQRQAMLDALAQEAQAAAMKDRGEGNALQRIGLQQRAADADMDRKDAGLARKNALEIARIGAQSREQVAGIAAQSRIDAKMPGASGGKTLPASVATPIFENRRNLDTIRRARLAIVQRPDAFGIQNRVPGFDYIDSTENVKARAPLANIGSLIIHDRSGAAVTVSEFPRLRPFIPTANDPPAKAAAKLEDLEREIRTMTDEMTAYYTAQGFAVPGSDAATGPRQRQDDMAPPPATTTATGAGKSMSTAAYEAAKAAGYSDADIRAEGWEVPQ
jgi:hypothetical protein